MRNDRATKPLGLRVDGPQIVLDCLAYRFTSLWLNHFGDVRRIDVSALVGDFFGLDHQEFASRLDQCAKFGKAV